MMMSESIWDEVDELPATFHERKLLSESFLKRALKGLLIEIIDRKILKPPYGRPDQPNPLVKLSDFLESGGLIESNEDTNNDGPLFSYDYGFDPLQYLADYMRFLHPDNIRKIKDEHRSAANQLASQANHARKVLLNFDHLKYLATRLRSGIVWGPFTSPYQSSVSSTSDVLCACRVAKCGNLIVEISKDSQFLLIDKSWSQAVSNEGETQKAHLTNLEYGMAYYLRCHLEINSSQNIPAMEPQLSSNSATERVISMRVDCGSDIDTTDHFYQYCGFTTFPPHVDSHVVEVSQQVEVIKLIALNINTQYITMDSIKDEARSPLEVCLTTCILGGLHAPLSEIHEEIVVSNDIVDLSESYMKQTFDMHRHLESFGASNSILRNSALLIGWHDRSKNSDIHLSEEETSIKKYLHDMRKYNLKYGIGKSKSMQRLPGLAAQGLSAPPKLLTTVVSAELNSVLQALPVEMYISGDKPSVNQLYSTSMLGPYVQLFVLDHRRGYLGKEQGTWLRETLSASTARFKIILSGTPFGATSSSCHSEASASRSQSSEISTDTVYETIVVESTEIPSTVKDVSTSSATHPAAVTMQIPLPILSLGIDDGGRPNLSLAGILAAYQLSSTAKTSGKSTSTYCASPGISRKHTDTDLKGDNDKNNKRTNDKMKNIQENILSASESGEFPIIYTESGILILSAGACVPHQNTKSAVHMGTEDHSAGIQGLRSPSVSGKVSTCGSHESDLNLRAHQEGEDNVNYNNEDSVLEPYLALCDPQGVGKSFCVELCVGGGGGLGGAAEELLPPTSIPSIGVTMLYNVSIQPSIPDSLECPPSSSGKYAGIVTLSENAMSLDLQLLAIKSTQKHDVIYRCTMRAASSTLM